MANNLLTQFPTQMDGTDLGNYPYGKARNIVVPGDGTGSPWVAAVLNDIFGFQQKLLTEAGISPSGNPETILASNYWDALINAIDANVPLPSTIEIGDPVRGILWTLNTNHSPTGSKQWNGVAYGKDGRFVAVAITGGADRVMYSPDGGLNWFTGNLITANDWRKVAYSPTLDRFVAVASSGAGNRAMTSDDGGLNWTVWGTPANNEWWDVCWGDGLFVAVSTGVAGTGNRVMTSADGAAWTIRTSAADHDWQSVAYGGGKYVAVAASGAGTRVMESSDAITWTLRFSAADNLWRSVAYNPTYNRFAAVSSVGVMTSDNGGVSWTIRTAPSQVWVSVIWARNRLIAVSTSGEVMTSKDGITWTENEGVGSNSWTDLAYGDGKVAAVSNTGSEGKVMSSGYLP